MDIKINEVSKSEKEIEVSLAYDDIKSNIETEVKKQTRKIQLPGFRKGKVPLHLIKKMYGDALEYEAAEKVANTQFWEISKEQHLHPIGQPQLTDLDFKPGEKLNFKVKYEVMPELEVKDYKNIEIEIPDFKVTDSEVEKEIDYILKSNSTKEDAEEVGEGKNFIISVDIARVDDEGNPLDDVKQQNMELDFANERIQPEILDNARGKKKGETFEFSFTDKRTEKDEEGKDKEVSETYQYKAEIKDIKKVVLPELTEDLIKKVTKDKVSTEAELRDQIQKDIEAYYEQQTDEITRGKLISEIIKNNDFTPPASLVSNILEELIKNEEEQQKRYGVQKIDRAEAANRLRKSAENEVKWFLIKNEIQQKEDVKVSDEDLKELAEKDAEKTGIAVDKLLNYYKSSNYGEKLIDKKLFEFLKENNNINKVDPEKFLNKEPEAENDKAE